MDELAHDGPTEGGLTRRDALKRGGIVVGAAALWTTPIVQTLGQRPASAGTPVRLSDFCPDDKSGQPNDMIYRYEWRESAFGAPNQQGDGTDGQYKVFQDDKLDPASPVCIRWQKTGPADTGFVTVSDGQTFQVPGKTGSKVDVTITDRCDNVQHFEFHTSCSDLWDIGDKFGSITTVNGSASGEDNFAIEPVIPEQNQETLNFAETGCGNLGECPSSDEPLDED